MRAFEGSPFLGERSWRQLEFGIDVGVVVEVRRAIALDHHRRAGHVHHLAAMRRAIDRDRRDSWCSDVTGDIRDVRERGVAGMELRTAHPEPALRHVRHLDDRCR